MNGVESVLQQGFDVERIEDRLVVHTLQGANSAIVVRQGSVILVSYKGAQYRVEPRRPAVQGRSVAASGELRALMPGLIVDIRSHIGDPVRKGATILVLESMKTQQPLHAPFDGFVREILVQRGTQVFEGALLAVIEMEESSSG